MRTRRYKSSGDANHSRSSGWKLAYADFVTSLMCFFMLMWLLNSVPSQSLKNIAAYFQPKIAFFSKSDNSEMAKNSDKNGSGNKLTNFTDSSISDYNAILKLTERIKSDLIRNNSPLHFSVSNTESGIEISVFDDNSNPMFKRNGINLTDEAVTIIEKVTKYLLYVPHHIAIGGYVDKSENADAWNVSIGRANAAMNVMTLNGLPEERIAKLIAYGDNLPLDAANPSSPQNRRITITLIPEWSGANYKQPISDAAISLR